MKGQFMIVSAVIATLIMIGTASTISHIQSQPINAEQPAYTLENVKLEAEKMDFTDSNDREKFESYVENIPKNTDTVYWPSRNCYNITLRSTQYSLKLNCIGGSYLAAPLRVILDLDSITDFNSNGVYNSTSAERNDESGNLGLGYLNGVSSDDLVGYWRLDRSSGSVIDYSGNSLNGVNHGASRGFQGIFGTNSFYFDGQNDFANISDSNELDVTDTFSISVWFKPNETIDASNDIAGLVSKKDAYGLWWQTQDDGELRFGTFGGRIRSSRAVWNANTWYHVVAVHDNDQSYIYVNGQLDNSNTNSDAVTATDEDIWIAADEWEIVVDGEPTYFNGTIDEVQIYNTALSQNEVKELYFYGSTGDFLGDYKSYNIDIASNHHLAYLEVNSTIPATTSATATIQHSSGSSETVNLDPGSSYRNYTLSLLSTGGDADIQIDLSSSDTEDTPVIKKLKLWTEKN